MNNKVNISKIGLDHQIFGSQAYGGISRYFTELLKHSLEYSDIDVKALAPLYINKYLYALPRECRSSLSAYLPAETKIITKMVRALNIPLSIITETCFKPNIIHQTYYSPITRKSNKAVTVLTVYDMIHELYPAYVLNDNTLARKTKAISNADHIICISNTTRNDLIRISNIDPRKITTIYLGHSYEEFVETRSDTIKSRRRPFILYVGERGYYKNFSQLLKAYASSKDIKREFDIVCFGGGKFKPEEIVYMNSLKINLSNVICLSGNDKLLMSLYREADCFVYPSLYEGFGIPPLEAMSQSCPCVCSNTNAIKEVAGDAAIYFDPFDTDSMVDALHKMLFNNMIRRDFILRGTRRAEFFSWQKCASETFSLYNKLA